MHVQTGDGEPCATSVALVEAVQEVIVSDKAGAGDGDAEPKPDQRGSTPGWFHRNRNAEKNGTKGYRRQRTGGGLFSSRMEAVEAALLDSGDAYGLS